MVLMPTVAHHTRIWAVFVVLATTLNGAQIPPLYLDCVVAIGRDAPVLNNGAPVIENGAVKMQWEPLASGFLYGEPNGQKNEKGPLYGVFLVTNRHVFQSTPVLSLRFNPKDGKPAKAYSVSLVGSDGKQAWFAPADPQIDVGVLRINLNFLRDDGIQAEFFSGDEVAADLAKIKDIGASEGDGVFVLGFPLQLVGGERNFVIVRQGVVARISDTLAGFSKTFLVDTFIFPGNSGGPVILKTDINAIAGTKRQDHSFLIGLVSSFQTYQEVAVSQQTGRPRVVFEENAGLANIVPVDQIRASIAEAIKADK